MQAVQAHGTTLGTTAACQALSLPRATFYRQLSPTMRRACPKPPRALDSGERQAVLDVLHSPEHLDQAPAAIVARLLDQGEYRCSVRTMYRILAEENEVRERRNQLRHPHYAKPELLPTAPNQVWSWDITKLRGPVKWTSFYLYVILDILSRYVVGWLLAHYETAALAR